MSGILMKCLFLTYQHAICQAKLEYTQRVYLIACYAIRTISVKRKIYIKLGGV